MAGSTLFIAVAALAAWIAWLQRSETLLRRRLRRILPEGEASGIDEILDRQHKRLDTLSERHDALTKLHNELEALTHRTIQRVGVIRYNPFPDTGGDQSFAIALLDAQGRSGANSNYYIMSELNANDEKTRSFPIDSSGRYVVRVGMSGVEGTKYKIEFGGSAFPAN